VIKRGERDENEEANEAFSATLFVLEVAISECARDADADDFENKILSERIVHLYSCGKPFNGSPSYKLLACCFHLSDAFIRVSIFRMRKIRRNS
jgi:hypothetical protein